MSVLSQSTIAKKVSFSGVGIHTGNKVKMSILPSPPNSGIVFKRTDLNQNNIVIPNFGIDRTKLNKLIYKSPNCFADTKDIFFDMIDKHLKKKYEKRNFSNDEKDCVDFYLGNTDGKAGIRLKKFIEENLYH